jgi:conjugal transfer pilus assembly protein TrbC
VWVTDLFFSSGTSVLRLSSILGSRLGLLWGWQSRLRHAALALLLVAGCCSGFCQAQGHPSITEADMARARQQHRMPSDAELARIPIPAPPRLDQLPQPPTSGGPGALDLNALSKGFEQGLAAQRSPFESPSSSGPSLLVFISLSMPETALNRLLDQAQIAGATLVLRGLVNGSLRDTALRVRQLIGRRKVSVQIDPEAFDRHAIQQVPTFVLRAATAAATSAQSGNIDTTVCNSTQCDSTRSASVRVAGDVTLDHALAHIERAAPAWAPHARVLLQRLAMPRREQP